MNLSVSDTEGMFRPRRIGHVNFWAKDYQKVAEFYRSVVGIEEAYRRPAVQAIFMSNGNTYHDVAFMDVDSPRGGGRPAGLHHFSLELENERDLVEGVRRCRDVGFEFDLTLSADVANSAYGADPDGNRFEVYADVKPDWRARRQGEVPTPNIPWTPGATAPLEQSFFPVDPEIVVVPDAIFHPRRVSHVVLVTRDHAAMVHHYTRIAGLRPLIGGPEAAFVVLGGLLREETLTLFRPRDGLAPGFHHFGMELPSEPEFEASRRRLLAAGLKPEFELDHETRRSLYLRDPSDQLIQFYVNRQIDYAAWERLPGDLALFVA